MSSTQAGDLDGNPLMEINALDVTDGAVSASNIMVGSSSSSTTSATLDAPETHFSQVPFTEMYSNEYNYKYYTSPLKERFTRIFYNQPSTVDYSTVESRVLSSLDAIMRNVRHSVISPATTGNDAASNTTFAMPVDSGIDVSAYSQELLSFSQEWQSFKYNEKKDLLVVNTEGGYSRWNVFVDDLLFKYAVESSEIHSRVLMKYRDFISMMRKFEDGTRYLKSEKFNVYDEERLVVPHVIAPDSIDTLYENFPPVRNMLLQRFYDLIQSRSAVSLKDSARVSQSMAAALRLNVNETNSLNDYVRQVQTGDPSKALSAISFVHMFGSSVILRLNFTDGKFNFMTAVGIMLAYLLPRCEFSYEQLDRMRIWFVYHVCGKFFSGFKYSTNIISSGSVTAFDEMLAEVERLAARGSKNNKEAINEIVKKIQSIFSLNKITNYHSTGFYKVIEITSEIASFESVPLPKPYDLLDHGHYTDRESALCTEMIELMTLLSQHSLYSNAGSRYSSLFKFMSELDWQPFLSYYDRFLSSMASMPNLRPIMMDEDLDNYMERNEEYLDIKDLASLVTRAEYDVSEVDLVQLFSTGFVDMFFGILRLGASFDELISLWSYINNYVRDVRTLSARDRVALVQKYRKFPTSLDAELFNLIGTNTKLLRKFDSYSSVLYGDKYSLSEELFSKYEPYRWVATSIYLVYRTDDSYKVSKEYGDFYCITDQEPDSVLGARELRSLVVNKEFRDHTRTHKIIQIKVPVVINPTWIETEPQDFPIPIDGDKGVVKGPVPLEIRVPGAYKRELEGVGWSDPPRVLFDLATISKNIISLDVDYPLTLAKEMSTSDSEYSIIKPTAVQFLPEDQSSL